MPNRKLVIAVALLAAVLLLAQLRYCLTFPDEVTIVQAPAAAATQDLLLERQPLVLMGTVENSEALLQGIMRNMHVTSRTEVLQGEAAHACRAAAHTALRPALAAAPVDARVVHPRWGARNAASAAAGQGLQGAFVEVRVHPGQALVLPFGWSYACAQPHVRTRYYDVSHSLAALALPLLGR